jgi:hypothetical protein
MNNTFDNLVPVPNGAKTLSGLGTIGPTLASDKERISAPFLRYYWLLVVENRPISL